MSRPASWTVGDPSVAPVRTGAENVTVTGADWQSAFTARMPDWTDAVPVRLSCAADASDRPATPRTASAMAMDLRRLVDFDIRCSRRLSSGGSRQLTETRPKSDLASGRGRH